MAKGKFIDENPVIEARLKELQHALENGELPNLEPAKEIPQPDATDDLLQITIIQGGVTVAVIGGNGKEDKKDKKTKKDRTPAAPRIEGEIITVKDLADEIGIDATELRKKLRGSDLEKPSGRWEWSPGHKDLAVIRTWKA